MFTKYLISDIRKNLREKLCWKSLKNFRTVTTLSAELLPVNESTGMLWDSLKCTSIYLDTILLLLEIWSCKEKENNFLFWIFNKFNFDRIIIENPRNFKDNYFRSTNDYWKRGTLPFKTLSDLSRFRSPRYAKKRLWFFFNRFLRVCCSFEHLTSTYPNVQTNGRRGSWK